MKKRSDFTLVELMVVIVIIAVLAAMALPILSIVIANLRNTSCQNNLRTMHKALTSYAAANNNRIPAASRTNDMKTRWMYSLTRFESEKMLVCPADENADDRGDMTRDGQGFLNPPYGYNRHFGTNGGESGPDRPLPSFKNPSRTLVIGDVEKYLLGGSGASKNYRLLGRHSEHANVLLLDGTVINDYPVNIEESPDNQNDPYIFEPFSTKNQNK